LPSEARDLAACHAAVDACFASEDYVGGRTAFMEKRKPAVLLNDTARLPAPR